ncbi:MAG TPA: tetratricopeptide repeat protein, partial [Ktedonobacteraceae bacterium]|nr:tetratricopeptide repeat protein [Ktedonobacteraceae bacterium]
GPAWACLLIQHGAICCLQGSYDEARSYVYEALSILEQAMKDTQPLQPDTFLTRTEQAVLGDPLEVGRAHELLGVVAASVGQLPDALKHLYTALEIFEQHGLVIAMAKVCGNLGAAYAMKAENMQARVYMRRSLELTERMGDLPNMAFVTGNLGEMANRSGDLQEAEEWFKRSLSISEQINDREHMSWCNVALGAVRQDQGRFRESAENLLRALAIGRAMKNSRCIGSALVAMADLRISQAIATGAPFLPSLTTTQEESSEVTLLQDVGASSATGLSSPLDKCQRLLRRAHSTLRRALELEGLETELTTEGRLLLATASFLLGEIEMAREQVLQTMQASEEHEITRILARSQRLLGRIMAIQGEHSQADDCFEQAMQVFRENEMRLDFARTLHSCGLTLLQRSQPDTQVYQQGIAYLQQARATFQACSATIDLEWITFQLSMYETQRIEDTLPTAETV